MIYVCDLLPPELEQFLSRAGHKPYRARQILRWAYKRSAQDAFVRRRRGRSPDRPAGGAPSASLRVNSAGPLPSSAKADFAHMSDLPQGLRDSLASCMGVHPLTEITRRNARDGSTKLALRLPDGLVIEAVSMPYAHRATACLSSQVGCAYNCAFCASGKTGLERNLTTAEIVGQLLCVRAVSGKPPSNVVFMGMGEPLANYDAVVKAVRILNHSACANIGARHIAISTCGLPEQMRRLAREGLGLHLAVSLNAPEDHLRSQLMPVNRRYGLREVIAAAREYATRTGRKIAFEYCLLAGVNDAPALAAATARLVQGLRCMVNLIPYNQAQGDFRRPSAAVVQAFRRELERHGVEVAVRRSFGEEVAAACGQLACAQRRAARSSARERAD